ncbi:MAG: hypothetical protein E7378_00460 [Clostridiales bacterium]|nr:hypothetical protein [Clostridiales bacterium]
MENKKESKKTIIILSSVIVLLSLVCIGSIIYNFMGGFYFGRIAEYNTILGEKLEIEVGGEGAFAKGCNFSGETILGTDIRQEVSLKFQNVQEPLYVRARANVSSVRGECIIFGFTNWVQQNDGYIYLNQPIMSNQSIGLSQFVRLSNNLKIEGDKNYILMFVVEVSKESWN